MHQCQTAAALPLGDNNLFRRATNAIDLRTLDRSPRRGRDHPHSGVVLSRMPAERAACRAGAAIADQIADEMREEHRRRPPRFAGRNQCFLPAAEPCMAVTFAPVACAIATLRCAAHRSSAAFFSAA